MTTREALHTYREKTVGRAPHERVYFFHAHIYYYSESKDETNKMHEVKARLEQQYSGDNHVEVHTLQVRSKGPSLIADHHTASYCVIADYHTESLKSDFACLALSFAVSYDKY